MHRSYFDIINRISIAPVWWQQDGVPRYDDFEPEFSTGVYGSEAVLAEIACQSCETTFVVLLEPSAQCPDLKSHILDHTLEYGDPPNVDCCAAGATMNSGMIRVLEYWSRHDPQYVLDGRIIDGRHSEWARDRSLEIEFDDPWGDGDSSPPIGNRWAPKR